MKHSVIVLGWFFLIASGYSPATFSTQGPFPDKKKCEDTSKDLTRFCRNGLLSGLPEGEDYEEDAQGNLEVVDRKTRKRLDRQFGCTGGSQAELVTPCWEVK